MIIDYNYFKRNCWKLQKFENKNDQNFKLIKTHQHNVEKSPKI